MPELPEVETMKRILEPQVRERKITELVVHRPEVLAHPTQVLFQDRVVGTVFTGMGRRGKYLLFYLSNHAVITLHLRMTGQILVTPQDFPEEKHTHVIFKLDNGSELRFIDTRRFGRLWLINENEKDTFTGIHKLGLEPFDPECNADYLIQALGKRRKTVKVCLLDQTVVAGIGNIYSDEILHASKIHPGRPANSLTYEEWCVLAETISAVLETMIEKNHMTPDEYLAGLGKAYRNTPSFQVYGRKEQACFSCGTLLERMVIGGRSSCYCPECQPGEAQ